MGGRIGEAWIVGRALSNEEVRADDEAKRARCAPAPAGEAVRLGLRLPRRRVLLPQDLRRLPRYSATAPKTRLE